MVVKNISENLLANRQVSEFEDITWLDSRKNRIFICRFIFKIGKEKNLPVKLRDEQIAVVIWLKCSAGGGMVCISSNLV